MLMYIAYKTVIYFNMFVIIYVVLMSVFNIVQMVLSMLYTQFYMKNVKFPDMKMYGESMNFVPMSILVPAYNEELTIVSNLQSLMALKYPTFEVVVVNDGSKDNTLQTVIDAFGMKKIAYPFRMQVQTQEVYGVYYNPEYPMLRLIDKKNGGKADALNVGINLSRYPYFVSIDADSLLDSDALVRIAMSFMNYKYTVAVGGIVRIVNGSKIENGKVVSLSLPKSSIARFQIVEYFRAFLVGRVGWGALNALLIVSGAFGAFQKEAALKVGGYTINTIGEDMDLILKLHKYMREKKYKYKIEFLPDPVCWTQAPEDIKSLHGQRRRWQIGLIDCLSRNRVMLMNPKYGFVGMLAMPYYLLFELIGPLVEATGLIVVPLSYMLGLILIEYFLLFLAATTLFGVILSVGALAIEEYSFDKYAKIREFLLLTLYGIIENFSYRQLTVYFRLTGILFYKKYKHSWCKMDRQKLVSEE